MNIPTKIIAEKLLDEAAKMNPGPWIEHSRVAGMCAAKIAEKCNDMDEETAYILGLLHDIGRRYGVTDMRHVIKSYRYMLELGYTDSARICLTHSFPYKDIKSYNGKNDCTAEESEFIQKFIDATEYNDYDKLIQLCDAVAYPTGPCYVEKRLVDVAMRRGFNDLTVTKWKSYFDIKDYFEEKMNGSVYDLLEIVL